MPQVNFVRQSKGINIVRNMPTPKRVGEIRYWLKGAQAYIKEIPRTIAESESMSYPMEGHDSWFVATSDVDVKWIRFNLENRFGDTAQIVINRKVSGLGA